MELERTAPAIRAMGAELVAASTDPIPVSIGLAKRLHLSYPLLRDEGRLLGLAFGDVGGGAAGMVDRDAVYVLDADGRVRWSHIISDEIPVKGSTVLAALRAA